ncbi:MAG: hypothetical protein M1828_007071 [Chrysothrix sp. TS-e1954]|nr:MAG: hypothetical protein M1828_007071 [Chrysothrix sp. TS-e1954]
MPDSPPTSGGRRELSVRSAQRQVARTGPTAYRVELIPEGTTKVDLLQLFSERCRSRITVASLCNAADWGPQSHTLTATCLFIPDGHLTKPELADDSLIIDSDFRGFTPLHTPLYRPDGALDADIIALTGMAGHAYGSWAQAADRMWLRDLLPQHFAKCRVLTYGYDAGLDANASRGVLFDHTNNFCQKLRIMRQDSQSLQRPIVFIGHSLGCLIIKDALINFHAFPNKRQLWAISPVASVVFIGAPHRGLEVTALQSLVKGTPSEDLVGELKRHSPTLTRLNDTFKNLDGEFNILTVYEMRDTPSVCQRKDGSWAREGPPVSMVPQDSAMLHWEKEELIGVDEDHKQIAKNRHGQSGYYNQLRAFIQRSLVTQFSMTVPTLFSAVREGDCTRVQIMLVKGMSVNCLDQFSNTPLHVALRSTELDMVRLLIDNGASILQVDRYGLLPIQLASLYCSAANIELLFEKGAIDTKQVNGQQKSLLHLAAEQNEQVEVFETLVRWGCDINGETISGATPLMVCVIACKPPKLEPVKELIRLGAALHTRTNLGSTVLHHAASYSSPAVVEHLLWMGSDPKAENVSGETPLHWAARNGKLDNARLLLAYNERVGLRTPTRRLPADFRFDDNVSTKTGHAVEALLGSPAPANLGRPVVFTDPREYRRSRRNTHLYS